MRLEINGWSSKITFSASHIIPGHVKCGRLHGHDYAINALIEGTVGEGGVIMDFISVKEVLRSIAAELDHRVIIPLGDGNVKVTKETVQYAVEEKQISLPKSDCALLDIDVASAEMLSEFVLRRVLDKVKFPRNVTHIEVGVDEGRGQGAWTGKDI
ncbi:MAG TPA: 6-pyruvoyl tetrahydropterin synthase family protein [Thermoplasmata archaeon]|nr:6-pyruvoyl tetrahydropterin synthase family protein [Thermoplasmata archaeon]